MDTIITGFHFKSYCGNIVFAVTNIGIPFAGDRPATGSKGRCPPPRNSAPRSSYDRFVGSRGLVVAEDLAET
jgi:hypothetical protein